MDSQIDSDNASETLEERAERLNDLREKVEREPNKHAYEKRFDIEVGEVLIEDRSTAEQHMLWKAQAEGEEYKAEHPADAVLGLMTQLMDGGEL